MRAKLVASREAAIAAAREFLKGTPAVDGPFSVVADQDFWIVRVEADGRTLVQVFVDAYDGTTAHYSGSVVDVALIKPAK